MAEVEQIVVVVQALWRDNGLQNASPLEHLYETHVRKLLINPLLLAQWCTRPKFEKKAE